jgi:Uma2 family endonuclease
MHMLGSRRDRSQLLERHRYKELLPPLHFPEREVVAESKQHLRLRVLLWQSLELELAGRASVGSDQFVYWRANGPDRKVAPDVFVKLGVALRDFASWKTWEQGGVPELAVEITSRSDEAEKPWSEKLEHYGELGAIELVRFDRRAPAGEALRVWDRVDDVLLEREAGERAEWSETLGLWWVTVPDPDLGRVLRLARDATGKDLIPTPTEEAILACELAERGRQEAVEAREAAERAREDERRAREAAEQAQQTAERAREDEQRAREAAEQAQQTAERAREDEQRAREAAEHARDDERQTRAAAEQRVRDLEEELRRRGG